MPNPLYKCMFFKLIVILFLNELELICLCTVKGFQAFLLNTKNYPRGWGVRDVMA